MRLADYSFLDTIFMTEFMKGKYMIIFIQAFRAEIIILLYTFTVRSELLLFPGRPTDNKQENELKSNLLHIDTLILQYRQEAKCCL